MFVVRLKTTTPSTSDRFDQTTRHRLAFDFDPNAPTPERWIQFLGELWDDPACHDLLHEWGGYSCLTLDTSHQKFLMLLGSPRGGKGTITSILTAMTGGNVARGTGASKREAQEAAATKLLELVTK